MRADLHIHTVASDGRWTPKQVVSEARARNLGLIAVADHDTVDSVEATRALVCEQEGLAFLRGVEISSRLNGARFHILGYGFEITPSLLRLLDRNITCWQDNNRAVISGLQACGYDVGLDEYAAYTYDQARGGWKTLNYMQDKGICGDVWDYLDNVVPKLDVGWPTFPPPDEVIGVIREAGGVPILAHPGASLRGEGVSESSLRVFLIAGIAGLECYSQYHDASVTRFCLDWCARHQLLVTGGSDCHGGLVGRELGVPAVDVSDLRLGELEERVICG